MEITAQLLLLLLVALGLQGVASAQATVVAPVITIVQPASPTSITVVWTQQGDVDSFEVAFERVTGAMQQGPCPSVEHSGTVTVNDGTARQQTVSGLEEFSTYSFAITAISNGRMSLPSDSMTATTQPAAPSGAPESLRAVAVTSTSITVAWDPVNCIDRNSEIIWYEVRYTVTESINRVVMIVPGSGDAGGIYTISQLTPFTNYSIQVAAVGKGTFLIGVFSNAIVVETLRQDATVVATVITSVQPASPTSITVVWAQQGDVDSFDIAYERVIGAMQLGPCPSVKDNGTVTVNDGTARQQTVSELEEFSTYSFTITTFSNGRMSLPSGSMTATTEQAAPSGAPESLRAVAVTSTSITVAWNPVSCIDRNSEIIHYEVRYHAESMRGVTMIVPGSGDAGGMYTISQLTPFTSYSIRVAAAKGFLLTGMFSTIIVETLQDATVVATVITTVQPVSPTSITVVWTQQGDVDSFDIAFERITGAMQQGPCPSVEDSGTVTVSDGTARQQTVSGLEEFSTYSFTITAFEGDMMSLPSDSMTATTEQAAPSGAPESVRPMAVTSTSITVAWDPVNCIDRNSEIIHYEVRYRAESMHGVTMIVPGSGDAGRMYTISQLTPFTNYSIRVAAVGKGTFLIGVFSNAIVVETLRQDATVAAPVITSVQPASPTSIMVEWTQQGDVDSFDIAYERVTGAMQQGPCPSVEDNGTVTVSDGTARQQTVSGLEEFSTYSFTITALADDVASLPSGSMAATTEQAAPSGAPEAVRAVAVTSTSITVEWDPVNCIDRNSEIAQYEVRYSAESMRSVTMTVPGSGDAGGMYTISQLAPFTSYSIRVAAAKGALLIGVTSNAIVVETEQDATVVAPVITTVQPASPTSITVVWTQQGDVDSFEIEFERVTGAMQQGPCPSVEDNGTVTVSDGSARQQTVIGLEEFSTYSFTITAMVDGGTSQPSGSMTATTEQAAPSGAPESVRAVAVTSTSITVAWDPVNCIDRNSEITRYEVRYRAESNNRVVMIVPGSGDAGGMYIISPLTPFTNYSIQVAATQSFLLIGVASNAIVVETLQDVPPPTVSISPTDGTATAGQSHSLTCSVTPGEGASGTPVVEWRGPGDSQLDGDSDIMVGSVSMVDSSTFTSTLDLTTLRTSHGGQYTCQAMADSPMGTANTIVIVQIPTPMVSVSHDGPPNNTLPGGSSVTFTCNITVDPAVDTDVTVMAPWTSTGARSGLSGSDPAVVQGAPVTTYQSSLTLDNMLTSDSGDYTCTASVIPSDPAFITSSVQQSFTVMITVELVVSISIDYTPPPDAVLGPNEYRAATRLTITCEVQGATGTVTYTWVSTLGGGENDMTRQRSFLRSTHGGVQTCTATDSGGNSGSTSITVNVVGIGVQLVNGDVDGDGVDDRTAALPNNGLVFSLTSRTRFRILCFSESSQDNVGEIIGLDGTPVTTGSVFTVATSNPGGIEIRSTVDIDMDDQGVYTCRLPDSSGTQILEANFGIYRNDFNTLPSVPTELTFDPIARTFTCISTGSPATTVTWRKNGVELDIDGPTYQLTQTVTDRHQVTYENVLTINLDLDPQSIAGTYTCLVNNTLGSSDPQDVNVSGIEITAPSQPLTVGGTATFNCTAVSSIQWLFSGEVVAEDTTGQQFLELTFDPVNDTIHERQYTCRVTATDGSTTIGVTVEVPMPAIEVSISAGGSSNAGETYILTCTVTELIDGLTNTPTLQWMNSSGVIVSDSRIIVGSPMTVGSVTTLTLIFDPLQFPDGGEYTCQATLVSPALVTAIEDSSMETVTVQVLPPVFTMVQPVFPTSIRVVWTQQGEVDSFEIEYERVTGAMQQGPCPSVEHSDTVTVNGTASQQTVMELEEFSTYSFTITATVGVTTFQPSDSMMATTQQSVPSGAPQSVMVVNMTPTTVTVTWDPVNCIDRNSNITNYAVQYNVMGSSEMTDTVPGTGDVGGSHTITGLLPDTMYSIAVAAVNSGGVTGPFSSPTTVTTSPVPPPTVSISPTDGTATAGQSHSLTCSVTRGEGASGTPVVEWRGPGGSQLDGDSDIMVGSVSMVDSSTFTSTLDLTTLRTSHGGQYTCQATADSPMVPGTATTSVIVQIPTPMVSVSHDGPPNNILPGGSSVTFTCTITVNPAVDTDVTVMAPWTSTGGRSGLSGSDPAVVQGEPVTTYQSSLTLDNLLTSDSGDYTCTASVISSDPTFITSSTQQSDTVMITVELVVSISIDYTPPPDAVLGPNEYRAASRLAITCQFPGATGTVTYTWSPETTLGGGVNDMTRQRDFLRSTHSGVQTCTATDSGGNSGSASITVNVVGIGVQLFNGDVDGDGVDDRTAGLPNNGLVFSLDVTSGNRFRILCLSESLQTDVGGIIGLDGTPITTGSVFTVANLNPAGIQIRSTVDIDMDDQGVYTCRLPDSSGTQTLEANFGIYTSDFNNAPYISNFTFDPTTRTLTCISTGSPATNVSWRKDGVVLIVDGTDYIMIQRITNRRMSTYQNILTIGDRVTDFIGVYNCTVCNVLGNSSKIAYASPVVAQIHSSGSGVVGEMYSLTCTVIVTEEASGRDVEVQWTGPGVQTAGVTESFSELIYTLTFAPLRESHGGQYICNATLPVDAISDTDTTTVTATRPTVSVQITASSPGTPTVGQSYTLTCSVSEADNLQPTITYRWTDSNGITVFNQVSTQTQGALFFSSLALSNASRYTCEVTVSSVLLSSDITGLSDMMDLSVQIPPPTTAITGGEGTLTTGSVWTLTCTITLDPVLENMLSDLTVSSVWSGPVIIGSTGRVSQIGAVEDPSDDRVFRNTLTFNPVRSSDDGGTYTCRAVVSSMPASAFVNNGNNSYNAIISVQNPTLTAVLEANTTRLPTHPDYNTFSLTCTATAPTGVVAEKTFTWRRELNGGGFTTVTDNDDTIQIDTTNANQPVSTSVLTVRETTPEQYTYRCRANFTDIVPSNSMNERRRDIGINVTGPSHPQQLQDVMHTDLTNNSATIQWTVLQLAYTPETYVVEYSTDSSSLDLRSETRMSGDNFSAQNISFSLELKDLFPGTLYYYQLNSSNSQNSTLSMIRSFRTEEIPPNPPRNFQITVVGPTTLTFSWNAPDLSNGNPSFYDLTCSPTLSGITVVSRTFTVTDPAESRSETLTDFEEGVTYNCSLLSRNVMGNGDPVYAYASPIGPPLNFEITVEEPRDLSFSWDPPAEDLRNGVIIGYQLSCSPQPTGLPRIYNQSEFNRGGGVEARLSGFAPSTSYNCSALASTSAGDGPIVNKGATTEDDAMLFQLQLTRIFPSCLEWVLQDTIAKLQDIQSAVQQNVERLCQCGFSEEHIPETQEVPIFQCFSDSTEVTFRARLNGTAQATSSELILVIEEWIASGPTINVQRVGLEISTCHPVAITSISDPECQEPTTTEPTTTPITTTADTGDSSQGSQSSNNTAGIIGGVVAVVIVSIIIAGTVIVIVLFILKNRRAELVLQKEHAEQGKPVELTVIGKTGNIPTTPNTAYETTIHQFHASVSTSTTSQQPQEQEYEVVGVPGKPENTAPTTVPETEDHTYDFIPGDAP